MKTLLTGLASCIWFAAPLQARLGETPAECSARYGEPLKVDKSTMTCAYSKAGLLIAATFRDGKCVAMTYRKDETQALDIPLPLSDEEIQTLLKVNANGQEWKAFGTSIERLEWQTPERYAYYNKIDNALCLATKGLVDELQKEKAAKEKQNLKDF